MLPERSVDTWPFMHVYVVCICVCVVCVYGVLCGVYVCMWYMYVVCVCGGCICVCDVCVYVCVCESMELSVRVHEKSSVDHQSHCNQQEQRLLFLKHVAVHTPVQNGNDLERDV